MILLQLAVAVVAGLMSRSLRMLDAHVLEDHGAVIHYHERLDELSDEVNAARTLKVARGVTPEARRIIAGQLSALYERLAQENVVASPGDLQAAAAMARQFRALITAPDDEPRFNGIMDAAADNLKVWRRRPIAAEADYHRQVAGIKRAYYIVQLSFMTVPVFLLAAVLCIEVLKRDSRRHSTQRERMEQELRRERATLEERIEARTTELRSEVKERLRAELLNQGRNQILEMLAREDPSHAVMQALVGVVAEERSTWGCALHVTAGDNLQMVASAGLPQRLMQKLEQLTVDMTDGPEAIALRKHDLHVLTDLSRERKPWPQLLFAYGVQSLWSNPISTADGRPIGTLTIYSLLQCEPLPRDVELLESHSQMVCMVLERYRLQDELRRHAYHDSLTAIPNRLLGELQLAGAIERASRSGKLIAVLWIDLDKFKQTNDVHGHVAGDAVLKEIAQRLKARFRGSDTIARMGGDEFMAVLEGVENATDAKKIARELVQELGRPTAFQGTLLETSASVGLAVFPDDGQTADLLQRNADMAMYEAKFARLGWSPFSPALDRRLSERREIEQAVVHALEHGGFELHYQPQFDCAEQLCGFEALLRFPHPVLGMLSPAQVIPIAEESHRIEALGSWVLHEACRQGQRWQDEGCGVVPIAVNISAMEFGLPDFAERVADALEVTGLCADLLELELTESVMVKDFEESARQLERLKRLGVRIALDDFGTGFSSLNQLHRLPIDRIKIDRSFIQALNAPEGSLPIVESIVTMAHRMGKTVVAEGVETATQRDTLKRLKCDVLQGYLFSRPVKESVAANLLQARTDRRLAGEAVVSLA